MTVSDEISTYHYVVAARQIDRRLALVILTVEEIVVFYRDVMRLIELNQIETIVVL